MQSLPRDSVNQTSPEVCYRIYLNDMSRVHSLIKMGVQPTNELNSLNAYYVSLSMSIVEKISIMLDMLDDRERDIFKFITERFTEDDFERALEFEYDFGKSLTNYTSFIEYQYSILADADGDIVTAAHVLFLMIDDDTLYLADEEGTGEQSAGKLLLKYENKKTKIVCFGDR